MKIYRPVKTNWVSQKYGAANTAPTMVALYESMGLKGHNGFDFAEGEGRPVYWNSDLKGRVVSLTTDLKLGLGVEVRTLENEKFHQHRHWHFSSLMCKVGQILEPGDIMGLCGMTGYATGPHDHYDIKPLVYENGIFRHEFPNNGYFGAIDPEPFFTNIFILDYVMQLKNIEGQIAVITEIIKRLKESIEIFIKGRNTK